MTEAHFVPERADDGRGDLVVLTGADLTIADVEAVARHGARAALDTHARDRMQEARDVIEALVARGEVVYGVTTGFGDLATTFIPPGDEAGLQANLIASHAAGVGRRSRARSCARCWCCGRTRSRSATRAAGRCSSTGSASSSRAGSTRSCRSRGASGRRATSPRSRTSRCR